MLRRHQLRLLRAVVAGWNMKFYFYILDTEGLKVFIVVEWERSL
jgi:hypothetical protein